MTRLSSVLIVALGLFLASPTEAAADAFPWRHDLDAARAEAAQSGRLILAHFWAPWCGPCKRLDQTVFTRPEVAKAITANYVPVKLNADQNRALAEHLGIKGVPNDVIFTPDGQVVGQFVSPATPEAYVARMAQVAASTGRRNSNPQVLATATSDRPNTGRVVRTQPVNSAYANLAVSTDAPGTSNTPPVVAAPAVQTTRQQIPGTNGLAVTPNRPVGTQPPVASAHMAAAANGPYRSELPAAQTTPPPSYVADRYAIPEQSPQVAASSNPARSSNLGRYTVSEPSGNSGLPPEITAPGAYNPPVARTAQLPAQTSPPTAQVAQNQPTSQQVAATPPAAQVAAATRPSDTTSPSSYGYGEPKSQEYASPNPKTGRPQPPAGNSSVAQNPIDFSHRQPGQNTTAKGPVIQNSASQTPGAPSLGLDGYCPISLQNASLPPNDPRRWVPGDARWGAVHRGKTYLFAGQAERDQFLQSPDSYAPVLSGMDPVLAFGSGQMVSGKRELGVWYGGKIFLFSTEQSIERFSQNPDLYVERIRQAMGVGKPTTLR